METAAGSLTCARALCRTTAKPSPAGGAGGGPEVSRHQVKLTAKGPAQALECTEGLSGDPECEFGGIVIEGDQFQVPGDGCLHVYQRSNAYFPLAKKYCLNSAGELRRIPQRVFQVGLVSTAAQDLRLSARRATSEAPRATPKGSRVDVMVAEVAPAADDIRDVVRYFVRDETGQRGWARPQDLVIGQCGPANNEFLCFRGD